MDALLSLALLTTFAGGDRWTLERPQAAQVRQADVPRQAGAFQRFVELSLSDEMIEVGYRRLSHRESDYYEFRLLAAEDSRQAAHARLVRQGQVIGEPLRLGVGLGAYAAFLDDPDASAYALTLIGTAEYDVPNVYPTTVAADLAFAPRIATFDDGERLYEFRLRVNVDLSDVAAGYAGFRVLEVDTDLGDREVDDGFHLGIRLAL